MPRPHVDRWSTAQETIDPGSPRHHRSPLHLLAITNAGAARAVTPIGAEFHD